MSIGGYTFVFDVDEAPRKNVFVDPTRRRRARVTTLFRLALAGALVWMVLFFNGTVSVAGALEELGYLLRSKLSWAGSEDSDASADPEPLARLLRAPDTGLLPGPDDLRPTLADHHRAAPESACTPKPAPVMAALANAGPARRVWGHLPTGRETAPLSLPRSCGVLDVLMPGWITLSLDADGPEIIVAPDDQRMATEEFRATTATTPGLLPVVRFAPGPGETGRGLLDPAIANRALRDTAAALDGLGAAGACLDFAALGDAERAALAPFITRFVRSFGAWGLETCLVLPGDGPGWRDARLTRGLDRVVLTLFQRAWVGSVPGPVADETWFAETVSEARGTLGSDRLVVALGNFALAWRAGEPLPERLTYGAAMHRVAEAGGEIRFAEATGNGFAAITGADGRRQRIWFLDAVSTHNQLKILDRLGISDVAIWSLGGEDPGVWPLLAADLRSPTETIDALAEVRLASHVHYEGEGAFLKVTAPPATGERRVTLSPETGRITAAAYDRLPTAYTVERYGKPAPRQLVLTFDDGPDPAYTGEILDILADKQAPGAFFVLGARVMQSPELLQRMVDEGHEVGAHSFSHPRMDRISRTRTELEHSMTAKLIGGHSGHDTKLYREPFQRAGGPIEEARVTSLATVQAQGSLIAGMDIVPKDWTGMSAAEITDYVVAEVERGTGNVLLFHDGGGDRRETVKALPVLIDALKARGYEFVPLATLLGTSRAALMPVSDSPRPGLDTVSFDLLSGTWDGLRLLFWVVLGLGLTRAMVILFLAVTHRRAPPIHSHEQPKVAFVVPAYNEEKSVAACVQRLLATTYPSFEVIVVDDGSQDDTFDEVQKLTTDRRVRLFAQLNHGKWGALNTAIRNTDAEILVCIDADTQVRPDALSHLVKHFANPRVGAVAGKVVVGNRVNLLTRLQALEYITAQNFERRAHDRLNSMLVVPGALGAWRRSALVKAGMYSADTVTEDADITVAVGRAGYRITYEDQAVAYTEAPETVRMLLSQRLRWSFGMFQTAWKHRRAVREGAPQGLVSIPDLVVFGYLYALIAPVADAFLLAFVITQFTADPVALSYGGGLMSLGPVILAYLALPLFELFVAGYALKADKLESLWMLLLFPFQRFFYRQLLYYSVLRALTRALLGSFTGWGMKKRMARDMLALQDA